MWFFSLDWLPRMRCCCRGAVLLPTPFPSAAAGGWGEAVTPNQAPRGSWGWLTWVNLREWGGLGGRAGSEGEEVKLPAGGKARDGGWDSPLCCLVT